MRLTVATILEVRVTPWVSTDGKPAWAESKVEAYRIWIAFDPIFSRWWQCHEWESEGGNGERYCERWIPSCRGWGNAVDPKPGDEAPTFN